MDYEQILYSVEDSVLTITLNRPERLNAFTERMCRELLDALDHADADDSVRAIIFTGAGRAYCAGADLGSGGDTFDSPAQGRKESPAEARDGGRLLTAPPYTCKQPRHAPSHGTPG